MAYKYHNSNPNGYHIPDCVIRAITTTTQLPYYDVVKMLHKNGKILKCDDLNVRCYEKLLDYDFRLPHYKGKGKTAQEIAEQYKNNILLLRMDGHLSCSIFGEIWDIFDCSKQEITDFWIVK